MTSDTLSRCGYVAIVGRPNVGKSTLLNHLLGQKISITSRKPQTTRHQVLGIKTEDKHQIIFVDTPGLHKEAGKAINRYMNRAASAAIRDVDLVVFVVDRTAWTEEDTIVLEQIGQSGLPTMLVVNKIDLLADKTELLPHLQIWPPKPNSRLSCRCPRCASIMLTRWNSKFSRYCLSLITFSLKTRSQIVVSGFSLLKLCEKKSCVN